MAKSLKPKAPTIKPPVNMKGQPCPYKPNMVLICQEGYCNDCEIYLRRRYK